MRNTTRCRIMSFSIAVCMLVIAVLGPATTSFVFAKSRIKETPQQFRTDPSYVRDVYNYLEKVLKSILKMNKINGFDPNTTTLETFLREAGKVDRQDKHARFTHIVTSLNHEAYESTTGHYGIHKDGKKGTFGDIDVVVSIVQKDDPNVPRRGIVSGTKRTSFARIPSQPTRATQKQLIAYLNKVLQSEQTFKAYCKAVTLAQFTTDKTCSTNPDHIAQAFDYLEQLPKGAIDKILQSNRALWKTILTQAYDASGGRCGIKDFGGVVKVGEEHSNPFCHDILTLNAQRLSHNALKEKIAFLGMVSLGTYNTFLTCVYSGYPVKICVIKSPDEFVRNFLLKTVLTNEGRLSMVDGMNYVNKKLGLPAIDPKNEQLRVAIDYGSQIGPVLIFHSLTNNVIKVFTNKGSYAMEITDPKKIPTLIPFKNTLEVIAVGTGIITLMHVCNSVNINCSKTMDLKNEDEVQRFKSLLIVVAAVVAVFCRNAACAKGVFANVSTEFAIMHTTSGKKCLFCSTPKAGVVQTVAINSTYATGVMLYVAGIVHSVKNFKMPKLFLQWFRSSPQWFRDIGLRMTQSIGNLFQNKGVSVAFNKIDALLPAKLKVGIVGAIALFVGVFSGGKYALELISEYERLYKKSTCIGHIPCAQSLVLAIKNVRNDVVLSWVLDRSVEARALLGKEDSARKALAKANTVAQSELGFLHLIDPILWANFSDELTNTFVRVCDRHANKTRSFDRTLCVIS